MSSPYPAYGRQNRSGVSTGYADLRRSRRPERAPRRTRSPACGHYHRSMKRPPDLVQDVLLGVVVAAMQVQGTLAKPADVGSRPLADVGHLGYLLLIVSGLALIGRRR